MIVLAASPRLAPPTAKVRESYLTGEQADMVHRGSDTSWLADASRDFAQFVADRVGVRERWGVPSEVFWFTAEEHYIGSLVIRHELPEDDLGGHIGYHVVHPWQRQGHATAMLGQALPLARGLGLDRVLLTVAADNAPSLGVVQRNGGTPDGANSDGQLRFWIDTPTAP
ncbi:GNAT family N-acetyltransferase [Streptomyces sp. NPDC048057]|uniref:GNAT family N-acetyltransferase n=1 Tax=Streptomyces sp. NPDC048057 TaxID=3155628 RepID=UPI0033D5DB30